MTRTVRRASTFTCLLCATALSGLLGGCAVVNAINNGIVEALEKESPPTTQAEAASAHVAVVAVARWDDYVKDIQPVFSISAAEALAQAIPSTASYRSRLVDAIRLGVQVGLPTSGTTSSATESTDTAGVTTTTETQSTTTNPGVAPPSPGFLGTVGSAASLSTLADTLDQDPFLKYSIAADLYEEVKILSRVLTDAKIKYNVEPYLVDCL